VKFIEYATSVFTVLLIGFMLYVSFYDLKRMSLFKSMFNRDIKIEQAQPANSTTPAK
ncbi:MAG: hypothetical protein RLZZ350_1183, partial [Verrucomicrobiota bacterium]